MRINYSQIFTGNPKPIKYYGKYRIDSVRLSDYNYASNGAYFVTICTENKEHFFGEIMTGKMELSMMGIVAEKYWVKISDHFPFVTLDEYIVMPNHVHGILIFNNVETPYMGVYSDFKADISTLTKKPLNHHLGIVINQYKRICTIEIKKIYDQLWQKADAHVIGQKADAHVGRLYGNSNKSFTWQSRFYDRIIRNEAELHGIREYIVNNPINWENDQTSIENL